jgi:predicted GNAT family acetyltransferase
MTDASARVVDNPDEGRYEIWVGDELGGILAYRQRPERLVFTHTEIYPAFEGKGLGSQLAKGALDDARARHFHVTPLCPFVASYVSRHPDYANLVATVR